MREPQPALTLLILEGLALLALLGWWTTRPPLARTADLLTILVAERVPTAPPATLLAQAQWLMQHRLRRLQGWAELSAVAGVIGAVEGSVWRRRQPFGGFGFVRLALGHVLGVGLLGAVAASLVVPVPLPEVPVAAALAAGTGVTMYLLAAGRWRIKKRRIGMATPLDSLLLETPIDQLRHLVATARSRRGRQLTATFLLSLYDGRGVALYHLRRFPPAQRAWFLAVLQAYLADPPGGIRRHRTRLYQLQQRKEGGVVW